MKPSDFDTRKDPCGFYSVTPLPTKEQLTSYYAEGYYQDCPNATYHQSYSEQELAWKRLKANLILHAVGRHVGARVPQQMALLEVGSGEGFQLEALVAAGYNARGIDFSEFGVTRFHPHLRNRLSTGDAYDLLKGFRAMGEAFDICIVGNVLEHVVDPRHLFDELKSVLAPGGLIHITVPNDFSGLQAYLRKNGLADHDYWFCPPDHLHYFNVDSIRAFVAERGFKILEAYADFPIEFYLLHSGSNYVLDRSKGKEAHQARMTLDLMLAERGVDKYFDYCAALTACGMGRNVSLLLSR